MNVANKTYLNKVGIKRINGLWFFDKNKDTFQLFMFLKLLVIPRYVKLLTIYMPLIKN